MLADPQSQILTFEGYSVDPASRSLSKASGEQIPLTPKVFDTLLFLVTNQGRVIGKDEFLSAVWADTIVEENNLSQTISAIRRVLGERPGERRFIETIAGRGFRFVPSVKIIDSKPIGTSTVSNADDLTDPASAAEPRSRQKLRPFGAALAAGAVVIAIIAGLYAYRKEQSSSPETIHSIAVLPFKPIVPEKSDPALELGMTDALIWKLSGGEVEVRPLSAVRRYGSLETDAVNAGRNIGVDAVLDGRMNVADKQVRISIQLIRVSDGKQLWADQFDDNFNGIFSVQDSISARVASELKVRLGANDKKRYTRNAEAYQLYLKGRYLSQRAQLAEINTSIDYFEQALAVDPNYVPAYVGLADAYRAKVLIADAAPAEALARAKTAVRQAISLDDSYAEAHAMMGWLLFWHDWDWPAAEREAKRALELDPNSSDAHQFYAHLLSNTGRHNEALREIARAIEIEPLSLRANSFYGMFLYQAGRYDQAIAQFRKTLDLDPNYRLALMFTSRSLAEQGKYEEAISAARKVKEVAEDATDVTTFEAYALAKSGDTPGAASILKHFLDESNRRYISPYNIALIFNVLGKNETALDYLEKAYIEKDIRMVFLNVEPKWTNLRETPRFSRLLKEMNLAGNVE